MISLQNEISLAVFNKLPRVIYTVTCNGGKPHIFLTQDSAFVKMENIQMQLEKIHCLERVGYCDHTTRPVFLETEGGSTYTLTSVGLEY